MLEAIRRFSTSLVGKIIFVILLIAFGSGFWYFGDPFSKESDTRWAVRVGDVEIPPEAVSGAYQRELARLRAASDGRIDAQQAKALGVPDAVITQIVGRTLLDLAAADLGLVVSDERVRQAIVNDPAFKGPLGTFDRNRLREVLAVAGYSEQQYQNLLRQDLARTQFADAAQSGLAAPAAMVDGFYLYRRERRVADIVRVADEAMTGVAVPDEAALRDFHARNAARFTAPEYRAITAVVIDPADVADGIAVSAEEIAAAYDENVGEYSSPEQRRLRQILTGDEATARRVYDRLRAGADFLAVAREDAGLDEDTVDLGLVGRSDLPADLADAAFALPAGGVSAPIRSPFGWHVLNVTAVEPARRRSLSEVRDEIAASLKRDRAIDVVHDIGSRLEDALGGGGSLADAAAKLDLKLLRFDVVDAEGHAPDGKPIAGLPHEIVDAAFATGVNEDSRLTTLNDGYFVVRVDAVTPPALKPFETVREAVIAATVAERRAEKARATAEAIADKLRAGADADLATKAHGLQATRTAAIDRTGGGATTPLPPPVVEAVFAATPQTPVVARGDDGVYVARVVEVIAADPSADQAGVAALQRQLTTALGNDLVEQILQALRQRYPVAVNPKMTEKLF